MGASGLMYFLGLPGQVTVGPTLTVSSVRERPSPGPWPLNTFALICNQSWGWWLGDSGLELRRRQPCGGPSVAVRGKGKTPRKVG